MPLSVEPPTPSGTLPEPSTVDPRRGTPDLSQGRSFDGAAGVAARSDAGSMRPLIVFLVVAAVALVGSIVFALVHMSSDGDRTRLTQAHTEIVRAVDEGRTAQDELADRIAAAEKVLASSEGRVADPAVRENLAGHVEAAKELGTLEAPTVPEVGSPGLESPEDVDALRAEATEWSITLSTTSTTLSAAIKDVQASSRQWQEEGNQAQAQAQPAADQVEQTAKQLEEATATLTSVTAQLEVSVRDSGYTLDWTAEAGAPEDVRSTLSTHRAEGETALAARVNTSRLSSVLVLGQQREAARAAIEQAAWDARATVADGSNGRLAQEDLCRVGVGPEGQDQYLRCDAAAAWDELGADFEAEFGKPLRVEYGYRPYDWQLQALDEFGSGQVAAPGTSNHGWAVAVDVPVDDGFRFGQPEFEWIAANGPGVGWVHPEWARQGAGREEPWHFEFEG